MIAISVNDLCLHFGTTVILDQVSFSLEETDKLGIIGVNGSGKSSLFRMITGEYEPSAGSVFISKGKSIGILRQDDAFRTDGEYAGDDSALSHMYHAFPHLLAAERRLAELEGLLQDTGLPDYDRLTREYTELHDRFLREGGLEFRGRCASILAKLGFDETQMHQDVRTLSGGQKTRLALAIQLSREPDILMLDEPTNHLDIETLAWLESFLVSYKKCVMVISHDRYFLDRITNKTLVIQNHRAKLYNGNYTRTMDQRETDRAIQQKHYDQQQKELERQQAFLDQQRRWNQAHNYVTIHAREKLLAKVERIDRPENAPKPIRMKFTSSLPSGNDVLMVRHLRMGFGDRVLFSDLTFDIRKGERVLLIGPNGCGKSTLIKLILNRLEPLSGRIEAGYNVEVGYYDQENQNLTMENTVLDELWNAYPRKTETEIRNALALFRFIGEDVYKTVGVLSGGERARLTLAKLILSRMNLLVLDEPTNHLDIDSREVLENALSGFDGTILVVSHDRYLIEKLATRILQIKPGDAFAGDLLDFPVGHPGQAYTEFSAYRQARIAERLSDPAAPVKEEPIGTGKAQYLQNKQRQSDEKKRQTRLHRLHERATQLETLLAEIEQSLYGDAATDYARVAELDRQKTDAEEELFGIYEELETLGE